MTAVTSLLETFKYNHFIMHLLTEDLSAEHAVWRMREQKGSSVMWTVGHLCRLRAETIRLLGGSGKQGNTELIADVMDAKKASADKFQPLMGVWHEFHAEVEKNLPGISEAVLQKAVKKPMAPPHVKTVFDALVFYGWHEAYHLGTIAMIRAELGYPGTSDRIMASFRG